MFGVHVDYHGNFVVGEVVQARFDDERIVSFQFSSNALRFLVDRAGDRRHFVGEEVLDSCRG